MTNEKKAWNDDRQWTVERAADFLEQYAAYIHRVKPEDIEQHPYLPELEQVAADLRVLAASSPSPEEAEAARQMEPRAALCPACGGTGEVRRMEFTPGGRKVQTVDKCPLCSDSARLDWLEQAYTDGGRYPKKWREFMTRVAEVGFRSAIDSERPLYTSPPVLQKSEAVPRFRIAPGETMDQHPRGEWVLWDDVKHLFGNAASEAEAAGTAGETRLPTKEEDAFLHRAAKAASKLLVAPGRLASPSSAQGEQGGKQ